MTHKKALLFAIPIAATLLATVVNSTSVYASSSKAQCQSDANAFDPSGTAAQDCLCNSWTRKHHEGGIDNGARGTIFIIGSGDKVPEVSSPTGTFPVYIKGAVYSCGRAGGSSMDAKYVRALTSSYNGASPDDQTQDALFNKSELSSITVKRGSRINDLWSWNWWGNAQNKAATTVNASSSVFFGRASKRSGGVYRTTTNLYRCPASNSKPEKDSCYTSSVNVVAVKIAKFANNGGTININGRTVSNGDSVEVGENVTSISATFNHNIKRADGWSQNASTPHSIDSGLTTSKPSLTISGGSNNNATNTKTLTDIPAGSRNKKQYCSTVAYYSTIGLDGYSKYSDNASHQLCIYVYSHIDEEILTQTVNGSSNVTQYDSTGNIAKNSGQNLEINLNHSESTAYVRFNHVVSLEKPYPVDITSISYSITDNESSTRNYTKSNLTLNGGATSSDNHTSDLISISVNAGASKTICQTLTWNPTAITIQRTGSNYSISGTPSGSSSKQACVTVKKPEDVHSSVSELSTVRLAGNSANNASGPGSVSITRSISQTTYTANFSHKFTDVGEGGINYIVYHEEFLDGTKDNAASGVIATGVADDTNFIRQAAVTIEVSGQHTKQVCEYVYYSPSSFTNYIGQGSKYADKVCATVEPPEGEQIELSSNSSATVCNTRDSSRVIPYTSATCNFHFTHNISNNNNFNLPTTYSITRTVKVIKDRAEVAGKARTYTPTNSSGRLIQNISVNVSPNNSYGPISNGLDYSIEAGETAQICETISYSSKSFMIYDLISAPTGVNDSGSSTSCGTVTRPDLVWEDFDGFEVTGETNVKVTPSSNVICDSDTNPTQCQLTGTGAASANFSHKLSRPYTNYATSVDLKYDIGQHASDSVSFSRFANVSLDNNSSVTIENNSLSNPNINAVGDLRVGESREFCRNIFFTESRFVLSRARLVANGVDYGEYKIGGQLVTMQRPVSGSVGNSPEKCVTVYRPYNFKITSLSNTKSTSTETNTTVFADDTITESYTIRVSKNKDNFAITDIPDANLRLLRIILDSDATPDNTTYTGSLSFSGSDPCALFNDRDHVRECSGPTNEIKTIKKGSVSDGSATYYPSDSSYSSTYFESLTVPNLPNGQKFCVALAVSPINSGEGRLSDFNHNWIISDFTCSTIGKKPTLQVYGGSIYSNGEISTSLSTRRESEDTRTTFGSWGDFSIIARRRTGSDKTSIEGMASGAALSEGKSAVSSPCDYSPLTISNTDCTKLGNANISRPSELLSEIKQRFADDFEETTIIDSPEIGKIYYSPDTITINTDIRNDNSYENSQTPAQTLIIAKNIIINKDVTRIDAWLLAEETVNTCDGRNTDNLTSEDCTGSNHTLIINGPVYANKIILPRTYGADPLESDNAGGLNTPAEQIDYTPLTLIWSYRKSIENSQPVTTYLRKLAPRY